MGTNRKEYARQHYEDNKQLYLQRAKDSNKRIRARNRAFIKRVKLRYGCQMPGCGYKRFDKALDFHHLDGKEKDTAVAVMAKDASMEALKAEIRKCILVCANCHREIHGGIAQLAGGASLKTKTVMGSNPSTATNLES